MRFCDKYIERRSRTHDQMVQAARSGVQNIVEGSQASGTSKKMELKLTNVARASLEELRRDYEDFLRQRGLPQWDRNDPRRTALIDQRPKGVEDVSQWARDSKQGECGRSGHSGRSGRNALGSEPTESTMSTKSTYPEIIANGALALINVASFLLDRQLASQAKSFLKTGGFTERLYRERRKHRSS